MLIPHKTPNGAAVVLAYEPATGDLGTHVPGTEPPDDTNPRIVSRSCDTSGTLMQLTLELSQACNLRCTYCPHTHQGRPEVRPHRDVHMSWDTAEQAMHIVQRRGNLDTVVCFYGGEPLLNASVLRQVVEAWPEYSYQVDTNGQLVDDDLAAWASDYDISWQISLDGGHIANDRYRGAGTFTGAARAIETIRSHDAGDIRLMATLAPPYLIFPAARALDEFFPDIAFTANIADLRGSGITPAAFPVEDLRAVYMDACLAGKREQCPRLIRQFFERDLISLRRMLVDSTGRYAEWIPGGCCDPAVRRLHVAATGELYPCERVATDYQIGTTATGIDFDRIEKMHQEFHVERTEAGCQDCWALRLCGGCWASRINCDAERARWTNTIKLYYDLWANGQGEWMDEAGEA